jgi:hypothetical protein
MEGDISGAIRAKRVLVLDYPPGERIVEPHTFGRGSDGQLLLRAYQTDGASASGEHQHWKLFRLDRARSILLGAPIFAGPRPGYKRGDSVMKGGIIAEL